MPKLKILKISKTTLGTGFPRQQEMLTVLKDHGVRLQLFGDFRDIQGPKFA